MGSNIFRTLELWSALSPCQTGCNHRLPKDENYRQDNGPPAAEEMSPDISLHLPRIGSEQIYYSYFGLSSDFRLNIFA